jgi:hypothetical protein
MKKIVIAAVAAGALAVSLAPSAIGGIDPVGLVYAPHDCTKPKIEPKRIVLACADNNAYLGKMEWKSWGGEKAKGQGWFYENTCDPNCAEGDFVSYGVKAKLKKIKTKQCGGQTVDLYRRAKLRFIGEVPPQAGNLKEWKLFCNA